MSVSGSSSGHFSPVGRVASEVLVRDGGDSGSLEGNHAARPLYRSLGFAASGDRVSVHVGQTTWTSLELELILATPRQNSGQVTEKGGI
ncbi:hypothetical protein ACFFX0_26755 [Citricoccus parietis]|uniref:Uncharacterized protein n=1 Tax=Citricoccus parietis TaxID=592307 RepID=A0ABV5G6P1_9MICC